MRVKWQPCFGGSKSDSLMTSFIMRQDFITVLHSCIRLQRTFIGPELLTCNTSGHATSSCLRLCDRKLSSSLHKIFEILAVFDAKSKINAVSEDHALQCVADYF